MRQPITIRLDPEIHRASKLRARHENRTLTNYIETLLLKDLNMPVSSSDEYRDSAGTEPDSRYDPPPPRHEESDEHYDFRRQLVGVLYDEGKH